MRVEVVHCGLLRTGQGVQCFVRTDCTYCPDRGQAPRHDRRPDRTPSPPTSCKADLTLEQLKQLVGPGRVRRGRRRLPGHRLGRDRLRGRQRHADRALLPVARGAWSSVAYSGPETRQPRPQVVRAALAARSASSSTAPSTPTARWPTTTAAHGDGVVDIALEVPDVDRCIAQARKAGATSCASRDDVTDEHGTVRIAAIATYGETRHTLVDRTGYDGPYLPGYVARATSSSARASRSGSSRRSTTSSATSSSATWTSGSSSTTRSWAS